MNRPALTWTVALFLSCSPTYKSGITECDADGKCSSGFVCGAAWVSGAPDVCYAQGETLGCDSSLSYWCPDSQACFPGKVACDTILYCADGGAFACADESGVPACSSESDECADVSRYSCDPQSGDTVCLTCLRRSCCSQVEACGTQRSCMNLDGCLSGCSPGDTSCESPCRNSYPSAIAAHDAMMTCFNNNCAASCK